MQQPEPLTDDEVHEMRLLWSMIGLEKARDRLCELEERRLLWGTVTRSPKAFDGLLPRVSPHSAR